jgi:cytoskeletal protein RodZ
VQAQKEFGQRLRNAREARGGVLRDIAATTKISMAALEGLERGDASKLPGGIFSRAFVRAYAREVGLDGDATVRDFVEAFPDPVQPLRDTPRLNEPVRERRWPGWLQGAVAPLVLVAAAGAGLSMMPWPAVERYLARVETPAAVSGALPTVSVADGPRVAPAEELQSPATPVDPAALPAVTPTAGRPGEGGAVPAAGLAETVVDAASAPLRLSMEPTGTCWVRVVSDGSVVFAREMRAGEREVREADGELVLTVGNAAAFSYRINDVPGRPLGPAGKVVTIRIRRSNLSEFVAP